MGRFGAMTSGEERSGEREEWVERFWSHMKGRRKKKEVHGEAIGKVGEVIISQILKE